jgi:lipoprotein-releasing system permease protein
MPASAAGRSPGGLAPGRRREVSRHPSVIGTAPFVRGETMLSLDGAGQRRAGAGYPARRGTPGLRRGRHMKEGHAGSAAGGEYNIILGSGTGLEPRRPYRRPGHGDHPAGPFHPRRGTAAAAPLHPGGDLRGGHVRIRPRHGLIHLEDGAKLFRLEDAVSGLRIKLDDLFRAAHRPGTGRPAATVLPGARLDPASMPISFAREDRENG